VSPQLSKAPSTQPRAAALHTPCFLYLTHLPQLLYPSAALTFSFRRRRRLVLG